jgi:hypothetical protein
VEAGAIHHAVQPQRNIAESKGAIGLRDADFIGAPFAACQDYASFAGTPATSACVQTAFALPALAITTKRIAARSIRFICSLTLLVPASGRTLAALFYVKQII